MTVSYAPRFDFIVVKPRPGVARTEIETGLVRTMGVKPENARELLDHLAEKGPVLLEKAVNAAKLEELKQKWEAVGLVTAASEVLTIVEEVLTVTCPACGHKQERKGDTEQCEKCGVFAHKFIEERKKREAVQRELNRLARMRAFEEQQKAAAAAPQRVNVDVAGIRRKIEDKARGLSKPVTRGIIGTAVLVAALAVGWFAREAISPSGITAEDIARQHARQAEKAAQPAAEAGDGDITGKELFPAGDRDAEFVTHMLAAAAGNAEVKGALGEGDRAIGLVEVAKSMAAGGNLEQIERALTMLTRSANAIRDDRQRAEKVSAVAAAQFEVFANEARSRAARGDSPAADKAFSRAMSVASEITTVPEAVLTRSRLARARARAGDYGGAALIFLDAMKTVDTIPEPRKRAIARADVARGLAEAGNDVGGAAERAFEKAMQEAAAVPKEDDRDGATDAVRQRRLEAAGNVASYLLTIAGGAYAARPALEQAEKDAEQLIDPLKKARAWGMLARITAEAQGGAETIEAFVGKIVKLAELVPKQSELLGAAVAQARAESLAAAAKFRAVKGDKSQARTGFLQALNAVSGVAAKSPDSVVRSEIAKQRIEAFSNIARYLQAAGDRQAAAKVFALAMEIAGGN